MKISCRHVWDIWGFNTNFNYLIIQLLLKITSTISHWQNSRIYEYANFTFLFISKVSLRVTRCLLLPTSLKSPFSVSACKRLQPSTSHLCKLYMGQWLASKLVVMPQNPAHTSTSLTFRFKVSTADSAANNSLLVWTVARTSFCTVKLKHPNEETIRKIYFWVDEGL